MRRKILDSMIICDLCVCDCDKLYLVYVSNNSLFPVTDVFYTRVTPSKMFDVLKEDFDYMFISSVLIGMILVSIISQKLAARKGLNRAWKWSCMKLRLFYIKCHIKYLYKLCSYWCKNVSVSAFKGEKKWNSSQKGKKLEPGIWI